MLNTFLSYYAQYFLHQKAVTKSAHIFAVILFSILSIPFSHFPPAIDERIAVSLIQFCPPSMSQAFGRGLFISETMH